jgi:DNA topoisomerase II
LLRPDTYVGSCEKAEEQAWVFSAEEQKLIQKTVAFTPGLYKIFDEILVNATDNKVRDPTMKELRVDIDKLEGTISVMNGGKGIPVEMHKEEGVYVPELIFGHLLTSSNYNDNEKKVTGGRNGYGAKLANIFSKEFIVETCDGSRERQYKQVFKNNMSEKGKPEIKKCKKTDNWTRITFKPDFEKFGMTELEDDSIALMSKRVYDAAGIIGHNTKIFLNGEQIKVKGFSDYVDLYLQGNENAPKIYEAQGDRWQVCVTVSQTQQFQQCSFVNGICTMKGGTHVESVAKGVTDELLKKIQKKEKSCKNLKAFQVKNHLWIFVNAQIENPAFDSQTKENLITKASNFGSKFTVSEKLIKQLMNTQIVENIMSWAQFKQSKDMKKTDGAKRLRLTGIPKLDDANNAGGRNSKDCTLILTEGDSAKALAVSGLSIVGRDNYGVFPLRGKLLNVRDASFDQVKNNVEINHIKQILGLQHGKEYDVESIKTLRYGKLMIMTDQDHDGSHIKGLLINFLHAHFPSLLKVPGFLLEFITPIIKATKGQQTRVFYTIPEYENWKVANGEGKGWSLKYYKGLGTSTAKEAKEYFAAIDLHRKTFSWETDGDGDLIDMAFSKKRVEDRKTWLSAYEEGTFLDQAGEIIKYDEFINKELILFSLADLMRSIPNVVDGFKPSQRKVMFACFKRKLKTDIKVAQLAGYVSEHSAYHHGEASLASTIVNLAQDFVGTNNINLLVPSGQFGTRLQGGKDHASPRYIFTRLAQLARVVFPECDDALLNYNDDDGQKIEPTYYLPVIPTVLINGAEGIGTGWSTSIPNFNARDIISNVRKILNDEEPVQMQPWYRHFKGEITEEIFKGERRFVASGTYHVRDECTLEITELPLRTWTGDYKEFLEEMIAPKDKKIAAFITDYKEYHTDTAVHFVITMPPANLAKAEEQGIEKIFKLQSKISCSNMHAFNEHSIITKYNSAEEIMKSFVPLRLKAYKDRREMLIKVAESELKRLANKTRFILAVVEGSLVVNKKKKAELVEELETMMYDKLPKTKTSSASAAASIPTDENDIATDESSDANASYDYLLSMPLWNLTLEKVEDLVREKEQKDAEVALLRSKTEKDLWFADLDALEENLDTLEDDDATAEEEMQKQVRAAARNQTKAGQKALAKKKKAITKKKTFDSDDDDDSESEFDNDFSDDDFEVSKPKKKAPAKPKAAAAVVAPKPASVVSTASAPAPAPAASKVVVDSDDDDVPQLSLAERLLQKSSAAMTAGLMQANRQDSFNFDAVAKMVDEVAYAPKPTINAPVAVKAKASAPAAAAAKKAPAKKKNKKDSSDSDCSFGSDDDDEVVLKPTAAVAVAAAAPRAGRNVQRKSYKVDDSSDDDNDDDDDDDESDFDGSDSE